MGEGRKEEGGSEKDEKRERRNGTREMYVERKRDLILKGQQTKAILKCKVMFDQKVKRDGKRCLLRVPAIVELLVLFDGGLQ